MDDRLCYHANSISLQFDHYPNLEPIPKMRDGRRSGKRPIGGGLANVQPSSPIGSRADESG